MMGAIIIQAEDMEKPAIDGLHDLPQTCCPGAGGRSPRPGRGPILGRRMQLCAIVLPPSRLPGSTGKARVGQVVERDRRTDTRQSTIRIVALLQEGLGEHAILL